MNLKRTLSLLLVFPMLLLGFQQADAQTKELTKEQILNRNFKGIVNPVPRVLGWDDNEHFITATFSQNGYVMKRVNVSTGEEEVYQRLQSDEPSVSVEGGNVYYKDGSETKQLTDTEANENNPELSPDGKKVAFSRNKDLYVIDVESGEETRLTHDGSDMISNGWASWVYMEEILGRSTRFQAYWWSPDSKNIGFMRFDDSPVKTFPIYLADGSYGTLIEQRYPKAGYDNPKVRVGVASVETAELTWADFDENEDQYFGMPYWTPDASALWIPWMNRDQDHLVIYEMNLNDGSKSEIYEEKQDTWIALDNSDMLQFLDNGKGFLFKSDKNGWMHLYHYDMEGELVNQVTEGEWALSNVERVDQENGVIYFTARKENSARFDFYRINLDGSNLQRLTFGEYNHSIQLSDDGKYFVSTYNNTSTPTKISVFDADGEKVRDIADARGPQYDDYKLPKTELIRVETKDGFDLPVKITWPESIDESKSYPLLVSIYGGPNSGTVYDRWSSPGMSNWWAKEGLIQVSIDHRGSGHFGKVGQDYLHRDLGNWEIQDYSYVVNWLIENYDFIDEDRIGITGFSYGGYVTCLALTKGSDIFDYGIAGGSVTDWDLYDTAYTERFMDRPQDNPEGYESSSVMTYADQYKGGLLIVHGSADDNVHLQNSLQLVSALESAGKDFEFIPYMGGKHGWYNLPGKQRHYMKKRYSFYYKNLLQKPMPEALLGN
ncbi:MAG: S9 family peptidase [Balneolaceae bacterium]|nr:S9 family peptidase [Balneolaceae bacterium]